MNSRNIAGFGKRIEYGLLGLMLQEGLDVYEPLIDYHGTDLVVKKSNGTFIEIQIKARSKAVALGAGARFSMIFHKKRKNYFFVFHSERLNTFWIMSSEELIKNSTQNKTGKHIGTRNINLTGKQTDVSFETSLSRRSFLAKGEAKKDKKTGKRSEYVYERFKKYITKDFSRFK